VDDEKKNPTRKPSTNALSDVAAAAAPAVSAVIKSTGASQQAFRKPLSLLILSELRA
jgi:hypothetical protein